MFAVKYPSIRLGLQNFQIAKNNFQFREFLKLMRAKSRLNNMNYLGIFVQRKTRIVLKKDMRP
jgi:hypothetical protein